MSALSCEACGEDTTGSRRIQCYHCGRFVCSWCWHHIHRCEPGHTRDACRNLAYVKRYGKPYLRRLRAVVLAEAAAKAKEDVTSRDVTRAAELAGRVIGGAFPPARRAMYGP